MKRKALLIFASLAVVLGTNSCTSDRPVEARPADTVRGLTLILLRQQTVPDSFQAVGTVRASRSAQIAAEIMGRVTAVNVREGDFVRQGQVVTAIEEAQPTANYQQAQAALSAADHEVTAAESQRVLAQSTFVRLKTLYEKKTISPHEFDEVNARAQSATARHDAALAARAQAAATLEQSRIVLDRTRVRAPFDGIVTERRVDPGALASPGLPLLTLESTGHYRLEASVNERDLKYVRIGATVPVSLDADETPLNGRVVQIIPAADPASRGFVIKVELPSNSTLRSGLYGHAELARGRKPALLVPPTAVVKNGQLQSVYVVDTENIAALRYVTLGAERTEGVEVLSGLAAGDKVISDPGGRDLAGKKIWVRE